MLDYYLMKLHAFVLLQANRLDDCFTLTIQNMLSDYIDVCVCVCLRTTHQGKLINTATF